VRLQHRQLQIEDMNLSTIVLKALKTLLVFELKSWMFYDCDEFCVKFVSGLAELCDSGVNFVVLLLSRVYVWDEGLALGRTHELSPHKFQLFNFIFSHFTLLSNQEYYYNQFKMLNILSNTSQPQNCQM
jgi:hypothetical protein